MRNIIIFFSSLIILSSCYQENVPVVTPPEILLSKEEMISILTDVYIAEGAIAYQKSQKTLPEGADITYYEQIFEKHKINHRILKENLSYYNSNPKNMELLLEEVLARLSRLQSEIETAPLPADTIDSLAIDSAFQILQDTLEQIQSDTLLLTLQDSTLQDSGLLKNN